ncbi:MAG: hypothetical protein IJX41_01930 [Bacteroidaceae bacterium]|nr:hypothetical protein [Bacteroidaceae bacterium]
MIKKIFAIASILLLSVTTKAAIGDWQIHTAYSDATYCQVVGSKIYVLASGSLFTYDKEDGEVYLYDRINELNDFDISHIAYCKDIDALVILYKNANIDILYSNGYVYNIPDFKSKIIPNKNINGITINGNKAYISTGFGLVVVNLEKLEFENTYNLNLNTYCSYLFNDHIYIGTENGIYRGATGDNLLDKANWIKINDSKIDNFTDYNEKTACVIGGKGLFTINDDKLETVVSVSSSRKYKFSYKKDDKIYLGWEGILTIVNSDGTFKHHTTTAGTNYLAVDGDRFWNCKGTKGIVENKISGAALVDGENYITTDTPIRNYCEYMRFVSDEKLLVAGGTLNYFDITFYPGTLMEYDYTNSKWINFPEDKMREQTGVKYVNMCSIDEDPTEPGHYFASSFGQGLYEFRDGALVAHYNNKNSPLESPIPETNPGVVNYIRVPRVEFDNDGNLWIVNTHCENIVKVLKKDGTWQSLYYKDIAHAETMIEIMVDSRGWLWLTTLQGWEGGGLFCAKMNNTPFDTSDDQTKKWLYKITNQDGTNYTINQLYSIKEDKNGEIWVGTDAGLFVIKNPTKFFNDGIFTQIKVPRNDGTGLADYLFNGAIVTTIEIDGANRKWIGTMNNGIYLVSADGYEMIHHFTTKNSILPSDNIQSIAINEKSGEVFIGTANGIVSYMSDATEPAATLQESVVHAYPNPVKASYSGNISIVGLTYDCEVKIVDAAGYLITEGTSTGGQFIWNGRNAKGEKVSSGVYYVLTYDVNGDESLATKILITR